MKLHDFLEAEYVRNNIALQVGYSPVGQGRVIATQKLINGQRSFLTFVGMVFIVVKYLLVLTKLMPAPKTAQEQVEGFKQQTQAVQQESASLNLERQAAIEAHLAQQQAQGNQGQV